MPAAVSHALLTWDHPCIEQQEIDRLTSLDQLGEGGLNAGRRVQIQLQRREDLFLGLSRELSGRLLDLGQAAPGDDDLAVALVGEHAGCRITEPGGGAGDERDRMFHGRLRGEGRVVRPREARPGLLISNYLVIYWCDGQLSRSFELNVSKCR